MFTVRISEGENGVFSNVEDAKKYIIDTNFSGNVMVYDINSKRTYEKAREIYQCISEYNKGKPLNEQILPTNPFECRGIVGCLGVCLIEIDLDTYENNHDKLALFTGFRYSVLDDQTGRIDIMPSQKALSSLALLGQMMSK